MDIEEFLLSKITVIVNVNGVPYTGIPTIRIPKVAKEIAEAIEESRPKWVSGIPKRTRGYYSGYFIVIMDDGSIAKSYYDFDRDKWGCEEMGDQKVTHYQLLPEPPTK